jgi:hypothetical protein
MANVELLCDYGRLMLNCCVCKALSTCCGTSGAVLLESTLLQRAALGRNYFVEFDLIN